MSLMQLADPLLADAVVSDEYVLEVRARSDVARDIVALELAAPHGGPLARWTPGAHLELLITGADGNELVRHYSLCGDPAEQGIYRIAVLAATDSRGGSAYVHERLHPGARVRVRGPHNHFPLLDAPRYAFVAGGIGITPILSMVRQAEAAGRPWSLVYLARSRERMAFLSELNALAGAVPDEMSPVQAWCDDERGAFDLVRLAGSLEPGTELYACGPERMLSRLEELKAGSTGWGLHLERFAATPTELDQVDEPFEVVTARSGTSYVVPAGCSILSVLREHGISAEWSCAEGVCGTCETAVVDGTPDHRDAVLSAEERAAGDYMMICVSRAKTSRLVLDI